MRFSTQVIWKLVQHLWLCLKTQLQMSCMVIEVAPLPHFLYFLWHIPPKTPISATSYFLINTSTFVLSQNFLKQELTLVFPQITLINISFKLQSLNYFSKRQLSRKSFLLYFRPFLCLTFKLPTRLSWFLEISLTHPQPPYLISPPVLNFFSSSFL